MNHTTKTLATLTATAALLFGATGCSTGNGAQNAAETTTSTLPTDCLGYDNFGGKATEFKASAGDTKTVCNDALMVLGRGVQDGLSEGDNSPTFPMTTTTGLTTVATCDIQSETHDYPDVSVTVHAFCEWNRDNGDVRKVSATLNSGGADGD